MALVALTTTLSSVLWARRRWHVDSSCTPLAPRDKGITLRCRQRTLFLFASIFFGNNMYFIRHALIPSDIPVVRELMQAHIDSVLPFFEVTGRHEEMAGLPGLYSPSKGGCLLVAESNDRQVIGCVAYRRYVLSDATVAAEVKRLMVNPEWRRKGVGRMLMNELLIEAKKAGYVRVILDTGKWKEGAQKLYDSMGFNRIETYSFDSHPDLIYYSLYL